MAQTSGKIRTRFAPSPTGYVHIGSLRTALFSFLFARHNGGTNILRIEDTDQGRLVADATDNLVRVLHDMGVEFDEGYYWDAESQSVQQKGEYGPYLQSERLALYQKHIDTLITEKKAYYCFCTSERLEELRAEQTALKKPPMYDRHCRTLSDTDTAQLLENMHREGKRPVVRQATPLEGETTFTDLVYGTVTVQHNLLDDQILLKSDGFPTYNFANIVDDHYMEITHVMRGEEFVPTTPKHVLLYQAFGWEPPQFIHLPLILSQDKTKLGKRHGDVSVESFIKAGYLKEALINFVALLGWNPKTEQELFSIDELIAQFDVAKIHKAGAIFDRAKLDWTNSHYLRQKSTDELTQLVMPYWVEAGYIISSAENLPTIPAFQDKPAPTEYLMGIVELEKERLKKLSEIAERTAYFFMEPTFNYELLSWKKSTLADAKEKLNAVATLLAQQERTVLTNKEALERLLLSFIKENNFDTGSVLWPLRVALTGQAASPGPFEVGSVLAAGLGTEALVQRIQKAANLIP